MSKKLDPPPRFDEVYRQGARNMEELEGRINHIEEIREGIERLIIDSYRELQELNSLDPINHNISKAIRVVLFRQSNKGMEKLHSQGVYKAKHGFYSDLMEPLIDVVDGNGHGGD